MLYLSKTCLVRWPEIIAMRSQRFRFGAAARFPLFFTFSVIRSAVGNPPFGPALKHSALASHRAPLF
jgi:hypothetical protein